MKITKYWQKGLILGIITFFITFIYFSYLILSFWNSWCVDPINCIKYEYIKAMLNHGKPLLYIGELFIPAIIGLIIDKMIEFRNRI